MITKPLRHPGGYAIVLKKEFLDAVGIAENTPLEVSVSGGAITIRPASAGLPREQLDGIMDRIERDYGRTLTDLSQQ